MEHFTDVVELFSKIITVFHGKFQACRVPILRQLDRLLVESFNCIFTVQLKLNHGIKYLLVK